MLTMNFFEFSFYFTFASLHKKNRHFKTKIQKKSFHFSFFYNTIAILNFQCFYSTCFVCISVHYFTLCIVHTIALFTTHKPVHNIQPIDNIPEQLADQPCFTVISFSSQLHTHPITILHPCYICHPPPILWPSPCHHYHKQPRQHFKPTNQKHCFHHQPLLDSPIQNKPDHPTQTTVQPPISATSEQVIHHSTIHFIPRIAFCLLTTNCCTTTSVPSTVSLATTVSFIQNCQPSIHLLLT